MGKIVAVHPWGEQWAVIEHKGRWDAFKYDLRHYGLKVALYNAYMMVFRWDKIAEKVEPDA